MIDKSQADANISQDGMEEEEEELDEEQNERFQNLISVAR